MKRLTIAAILGLTLGTCSMAIPDVLVKPQIQMQTNVSKIETTDILKQLEAQAPVKTEDKQEEQKVELAEIPQRELPAKQPVIASRGGSIQQYNHQDLDLIARTIYGEAQGEPHDGQLAVANVMLNRVAYNKTHENSFASTIKGLLTPKQFNAVKDPQFYNREIPQEYYEVAREALMGATVLPSDVIYFYNPKTAKDKWIRTRPVYKQIGDHVFAY